MPIDTALLSLPISDLAIIGGLALFCLVAGWQTHRVSSRGREEALKRSALEAKGAVPLLESAVRSREQRADALASQVKELKERLAGHETALRQKDLEIAKRERDVRSLNSELKVLKDGSTNAGQVLSLEGDEPEPGPTSTDPEMAKRYAALEARYDALAKGLFQRDDRIAELEEQLKNPDSAVPTRTLEQELAQLEQTSEELKARLQERDEQLQALQTQLQEEVAQRESLEDLAKRRSEGKRELKAAAAKFQQQIPVLERTIKERDDELAERQEKLVAMNRSLRQARQQREAHEAEIASLKQQAETLASNHRELEEHLRKHQDAHQVLQAKLNQSQQNLHTAEATVRARDATIAESEQRLAEASERTAAAERMTATLQNTIKDRDFMIAERDEQVASLNRTLEEERQTRAAREDALESLQAQAEAGTSRQRDLEQRLNQQDESYRTLEGELRKANDARRAAEESVRQQEAAVADAERRVAEADQRTDAGARTAAALEQAIQDRDARIAELEAAAEQQTAKLEMLRSTFFEAKTEHKERIAELNARFDEQRLALEKTIAEQQTALTDRELEASERTGTADELASARDTVEALTRQVDELTASLERSSSALRRRECAVLLLVARFGASPLLLPGPEAAEPIEEADGSCLDGQAQAEVA